MRFLKYQSSTLCKLGYDCMDARDRAMQERLPSDSVTQHLPHGLVQVASFNSGFPSYQVNLSDESIDMAVIGRVVAFMHEW